MSYSVQKSRNFLSLKSNGTTIASLDMSEKTAKTIVNKLNLFDEMFEELSIIHSDMIPEGPDCESWHRIKLLLKRARGES